MKKDTSKLAQNLLELKDQLPKGYDVLWGHTVTEGDTNVKMNCGNHFEFIEILERMKGADQPDEGFVAVRNFLTFAFNNSGAIAEALIEIVGGWSGEIPWELIDENYLYAAIDQNGSVYAYATPPTMDSVQWNTTDLDLFDFYELNEAFRKAVNFPEFVGDWKKSLVERPL